MEYAKANGGDPLDHKECTRVQLTALGAKLAQDIAPYTDFAVWGSFGQRQARLMKYNAQIWVEGGLQTRMFRGPSSFDPWRRCWRVFRTGMLTLKVARPGVIDEHEEVVQSYSRSFPDC